MTDTNCTVFQENFQLQLCFFSPKMRRCVGGVRGLTSFPATWGKKTTGFFSRGKLHLELD